MSDNKQPETMIASRTPNDGREWDAQCARCGSSLERESCEECDGDGVSHHDCGEDVCCCADPDERNVTCDACGGDGGWWRCASDHGPSPTWCEQNPRPGHGAQPCSTPEWYVPA